MSVNRKLLFIVFLFLTFFSVKVFAGSQLSLAVGQTKRIKIPNLKKIAVGNSKIADVKLVGTDSVLIFGKSPGLTTLSFRSNSGNRQITVKVLSYNQDIVYTEVSALLGDIEGIEIKKVGDRIFIEGEIIKKDDNEKVDKILQLYPQVLSFVKFTQISLEKMIKIDVKIMEISEKDDDNLGINWQDILKLQGNISWNNVLPGSGPTFSLGMISNFSSLLALATTSGLARVVSNPIIITRNGEEAKFTVGGEIPVPVSQQQGQVSIQWKNYGTILKFQGWGDKLDNILLKINIENSDVDWGTGVESSGFKIPGVLKRKAETQINVKSGKTIALAELILTRKHKSIDRFFPLGYIPILGEFFRHRSMETSNNRFLIFITPTILPADYSNKKSIKNMYKKYREMEPKFKYRFIE